MAAQGESRSWMAGAGFAAAFSLAVIAGFMLLNAQPEAELLPESPLELVLVNEDFEMLEQELAFYSWAESELADQG